MTREARHRAAIHLGPPGAKEEARPRRRHDEPSILLRYDYESDEMRGVGRQTGFSPESRTAATRNETKYQEGAAG